MFKIFRFEEKPKDKEIREYLLKEELRTYILKNIDSYDFSQLLFDNVNEHFGLWINPIVYIVAIRNTDNNDKYEYNSKEKSLSLCAFNNKRISVNYIKENLNYLINLEILLNKFFANKQKNK
ncbi:MAG: hypothetical protein PVH88_09095 [Ignavibacteria bacterium]|jgi:hypothetical protein